MSNPGSFSTTVGSDDFNLQDGHFQLSPARVTAGAAPGSVHDTTAYSSIPAEDGWIQHLHGHTVTPAKVTAGATLGTNTRGLLT
jgi:hypothetical protein